MSGGTIIAPGADVTLSGRQRATEVALDILLAVALVLALPLAFGLVVALLQFLANSVLHLGAT